MKKRQCFARKQVVDVVALEVRRGALAVAEQMIGVLAMRVALIEEPE
jgi:hypothetical protein